MNFTQCLKLSFTWGANVSGCILTTFPQIPQLSVVTLKNVSSNGGSHAVHFEILLHR